MSNISKPILSIGMIFKNEIRCLERCVKALAPLREAVPCELVMADTGSGDGSREIAEKYADLVFDFPWIDDFSAARNAVMDRCSGKWYFSVDADEYLDGDISELAAFLRDRGTARLDTASIVVRNYQTFEMDGEYADFQAIRLLRMDTGMRYTGRIHERWPFPEDIPVAGKSLEKTILHHDGYVDLYGKTGEGKRKRNLALLREVMKEAPEDLRAQMQFLESGRGEPDYRERLFRAVELAKGEKPFAYGPPIIRQAVTEAVIHHFPQAGEWIAWAEEHFPDSLFFRVDIASCAAIFYRTGPEKNTAKTAYYGEIYIKNLEGLRAGRGNTEDLRISSLNHAHRGQEQKVRIALAGAFQETGRIEDALEQLGKLDFAALDARQAAMVCDTLYRVHSGSSLDTAPVMTALWDGLSKEGNGMQMALLTASGGAMFAYRHMEEEKRMGAVRLSCTVFRPLMGRHMLGISAAIVSAEDAPEAETLLKTVKDWKEIHPGALIYALALGVSFPLSGRPMALEEMDALAAHISQDREGIQAVLTAELPMDFAGKWQALAWVRAVALAAVQSCSWEEEENGLELARAFAQAEGEFLPRYYAGELLCDENILVLPPMHRFGWYCARAFDALDGGDAVQYVRLLQKGLAACPNMKKMVEFLSGHTPELQSPKPSGELLELAEKVRMMLSAYAPDDPAVLAIKASPVYQKVAHLIEGPEVRIYGGLAQ